VVRILDKMIREKINYTDFLRVGKSNEYFLWNFLSKNQNETNTAIFSYFDEHKFLSHQLREFLDVVPINYFESYTEDSVDFLMGLGFNHNELYKPPREELVGKVRKEHYFYPYLLLFKKFELINSTKYHCYCVEGITQMILKSAPKILDNLDLD